MNLRKLTLFIAGLFLLLSSVPNFANELSLDQEKEILRDLDLRAKKKWYPLKEKQEDNSWVQDQVELGLYGAIYDKGWLNPRVSRQIVPDLNEGFLVVDRVILGEGIMTQIASVSSNLLLGYYFPYIQGGPIYEKVFTRIQTAKTYREALLKETYELETFPFAAKDLNQIEIDEIHSTITTNGFFTRLSTGLFDMLGLDIPSPISLGPKIKYHLKKSIKVSVTKETETTVIIALEDIHEQMKGAGIGLGVYLEEMITLPISIGIDGQQGYSPLVINHKRTTQKVKSLVYKIDLSDPEGESAYQAFLKSDLTKIQDLSEIEDSPVRLDIVKEGVIQTNESNFAINLILFRTGERNISVHGKYITKVSGEKEFKYEEIIRKRVKDRRGFSGTEKDILTFSTIVPVESEQTNFVLDSIYYYEDSEAEGDELMEVSEKISLLGIPAGIPVRFDEDKDYGKVQVQARLRLGATAIKKLFNSNSPEIWISIASAFGLSDPYQWESKRERDLYKKKNYVSSHKRNNFHNRNSNRNRLTKKEKTKLERLELLEKASKVYRSYQKIFSQPNSLEKAKRLIKELHNEKTGNYLHKSIVDLVGLDEINGRGYIRGRGL